MLVVRGTRGRRLSQQSGASRSVATCVTNSVQESAARAGARADADHPAAQLGRTYSRRADVGTPEPSACAP
eukprot:5325184-Prymnesium_polylepis.1